MSGDPICTRCDRPLSEHDYDGACPWADDFASIEQWYVECAAAQRTADSRRIVEINKRHRRRERAGVVLCLLALIFTLFIIAVPR